MAEHDDFERRLGAALARHVADWPTDFDAMAFARVVVGNEPRRRGLAGWVQHGGLGVPRAAWILLASVALLAALIGGALLAGSRPPLEHPAVVPPVPLSPMPARPTPLPARPGDVAPVPTALEAVITGCEAENRTVVTDGLGVAWRGTAGQVAQFDPAAGWARSWTVFGDTDLTPGAEDTRIAPARDGGVWLAGLHALRHFDGTAIRQILETPARVTTVTEEADGTLWAATEDGAILRWDESAWTRLDAHRPNEDAVINAIAVDAQGQPWLGWIQTETDVAVGWVSRYDGSSWTTFDEHALPPLGGDILDIEVLPDDEILVLSSDGIARFDGSVWVDLTEGYPDKTLPFYLAIGPDGAVWVAGRDAAGPVIARLDGEVWDVFGPAEGLPLDDPSAWGHSAPALFAASGRMYATVDLETYGLAGGRWEQLGPGTAGPCDISELLAVSAEELWAPTYVGLWHAVEGSWTTPTNAPADDLVLAPDGTVWAANFGGIGVEREGRWSIADAFPASALAVAPDGALWACGDRTEGCDLLVLRPSGTGWTRDQLTASFPSDLFGPAGSLAVDPAGGVWAASMGAYLPGWLAHFDGQRWTPITEIAGRGFYGAEVKGIAGDGALWVVYWVLNEGPFSARWNGSGWTDTDPGTPLLDGLIVAPDGSVWRGLDRYVDGVWTRPAAWAGLPAMTIATMAPDGTAFARLGDNYYRLPSLGEP